LKLHQARGFGENKMSLTENEELFGKQIYGPSTETPENERLKIKNETLQSENLGLSLKIQEF
jgi:hypothetical protein